MQTSRAGTTSIKATTWAGDSEMASKRVHRRQALDEINSEIERRRAADYDIDREYTTPERLAALRGEPDLGPPDVERADLLQSWARAAPPGATGRGRKAEPTREVDIDAEVEERIRDEIDDFEREGSCVARGAELRGEARAAGTAPTVGRGRGGRRVAKGQSGREDRGELQHEPGAVRAAPGVGRAAEPSGAGERVASGRPEEDAAARSHAKRGREPQSVRRIDYRAAAPDAFAAMSRLEAFVRRCGLEQPLLELVELRASQLNGCASGIAMHRRGARRAGEAEQRLDALETWRDTQLFTQRERAALAWTEAVTCLGPDRVSDRTFRMVREQFRDPELVKLTLAIIAINGWNRLAIAFRAEGSPHASRPPAGPP